MAQSLSLCDTKHPVHGHPFGSTSQAICSMMMSHQPWVRSRACLLMPHVPSAFLPACFVDESPSRCQSVYFQKSYLSLHHRTYGRPAISSMNLLKVLCWRALTTPGDGKSPTGAPVAVHGWSTLQDMCSHGEGICSRRQVHVSSSFHNVIGVIRNNGTGQDWFSSRHLLTWDISGTNGAGAQ